MNGRAYDYNLGRFLSVDPFIQAPGNSQSMNPYSYIMNNPLAGTDPSGYVSVGNLGVTEHCGFHCMTGTDNIQWAGDNGSRWKQRRSAAEEAKNQSIIGQLESQGHAVEVRRWNGDKFKLENLPFVIAVTGGTDFSQVSDIYRYAGFQCMSSKCMVNHLLGEAQDFMSQVQINMAATVPFGGDPHDSDSLGRQLADVADPITPLIDSTQSFLNEDYSQAAISAVIGICRPCKGGDKVIEHLDPRALISRQGRDEMSSSQVKRLRKSMKKDGYKENEYIDAANVNGKLIIIDGHHRTKAAIGAGVKKVPVRVHKVNQEQADQLLIEAAGARQ